MLAFRSLDSQPKLSDLHQACFVVLAGHVGHFDIGPEVSVGTSEDFEKAKDLILKSYERS